MVMSSTLPKTGHAMRARPAVGLSSVSCRTVLQISAYHARKASSGSRQCVSRTVLQISAYHARKASSGSRQCVSKTDLQISACHATRPAVGLSSVSCSSDFSISAGHDAALENASGCDHLSVADVALECASGRVACVKKASSGSAHKLFYRCGTGCV